MKKINIEDAIGKTLCHDVTAMFDGFKGAAFKRGHIITKDDIPKLLDYGKKHIFIYEDIENEIHEEEAAKRISEMTKVENAHYSEISEGKTQLIADIDGMFIVDTELLKKVNEIDDITISTFPNHYRVKKGQAVASMRIVPLTTNKTNIEKAEELCKNKQLYNLIPYKQMNVGIVITGSEIYSGRIQDKFEKVAREKLKNFPANILLVEYCDDDIEMLKQIIQKMINAKCDLIIASGGMSVDPDDITPTAILALGADVISHGVPSQPGNMTLVSYYNDTAILGVPGAAISLPTTIFDVLLPQIFTKIKFTNEDLINLAQGGLCQKCNNCHYPNCTFGRY